MIDALSEVLGPPPIGTEPPSLAAVVVPPEGTIRGLSVQMAEPGTWPRDVAEEQLDWLLGVLGAHDARRLLYELFLESNGRPAGTAPADWSGRLSSDQRQELLSIPAAAADRSGVLAAHLAGRDAFIRTGRGLLGDAWPSAMEAAVVAHVDAAIAATSEA